MAEKSDEENTQNSKEPNNEWSKEKEDMSEEELKLEKEHFEKIINAFLYYKVYARGELQRLWHNYTVLTKHHQSYLKTYPAHINHCYEAVDKNTKFLESIVSNAVGVFENSEISEFDPSSASTRLHEASGFDMTKVYTTLKQFFRDWSKEGAEERKMCYGPIIKEILEQFPSSKCQPSSVKILVPGSGLGRLAFDIAHLGYYCQGNEFSMYMLIASNFVLNRCSEIGGHVIYPWVLQSCNNYTKQDQLSAIHFPDVNPSDLPYYGLFSVAAGDFLEIYSVEDHWDCIACSYFIDTAHNIISYLEKIYEILKPGGLWINFGPLLYHFADIPHELSLELSWEDVRSIALKLGFEILKEEHNCPSSYIQNPNSMMHLNYQCVFLVARKPFPLNNK